LGNQRRSVRQRGVNALFSLYAWAEIAVVAIAGFFVQLLLAVLTLPFDRGRKIVGRWLRLEAVAAVKLSPFWEFDVHGTPPTAPRGKTVVVSNHESNADPFLICLLPWEMKWLAKASLFKVPFAGWGMRLAGDIPVERGDAESGRNALERCAVWLERGVPVVVFPEGTRSRTGELLPFKDGAFRLAIESGADVLPVAVAGTRRALPKHSWRFSRARALVTVGAPLSTRGMTAADLPRLKAAAREQIESLRHTLSPLVEDEPAALREQSGATP
jgi:1-acyl-sn-glycerol-3-phosphate acyltransferase